MPSTRPDSPAGDDRALALERALGLLEQHPVAAAFGLVGDRHGPARRSTGSVTSANASARRPVRPVARRRPMHVRPVAELVDRPLHLLAHLRADVRVVADDVGDGLHRDAGVLRHVLKPDPPSASSRVLMRLPAGVTLQRTACGHVRVDTAVQRCNIRRTCQRCNPAPAPPVMRASSEGSRERLTQGRESHEEAIRRTRDRSGGHRGPRARADGLRTAPDRAAAETSPSRRLHRPEGHHHASGTAGRAAQPPCSCRS